MNNSGWVINTHPEVNNQMIFNDLRFIIDFPSYNCRQIFFSDKDHAYIDNTFSTLMSSRSIGFAMRIALLNGTYTI